MKPLAGKQNITQPITNITQPPRVDSGVVTLAPGVGVGVLHFWNLYNPNSKLAITGLTVSVEILFRVVIINALHRDRVHRGDDIFKEISPP